MRELKRRTPHIRGPALGPARRLPGDRSGIPVKGYKQTESTREGHLSAMSVELGQHLLSGFNPAILSFLENGDAAEVGVGKEYAVVEARQAAALFGENGADGGADHGVAHAHDLNARDALANIGVDTFEVVQDGLLPVGPIFFEEKLAILRGGAFGESPVKSPDGAVDVGAQALVHGVNVAERGGIEEDGVPGGLGATGIGIAVKRKVGGQPGRINKIAQAWEIFQEVRREKRGGGENDKFGLKLSFAGEDADTAAGLCDLVHHLTSANVLADALKEAPGDPAVAFGPGERAFFLRLAGREIMDSGPGRSGARERAVIVATGVVHVPMQETRIKALLAEPIGKREAVEGMKLRREPEFKRDGKRSALPKIVEKIFKALKLIAVCLFKAHGRLDTFLPAAVEKQALLRRKSEITFFPSAILENTEIFEEFADVFGLRAG